MNTSEKADKLFDAWRERRAIEGDSELASLRDAELGNEIQRKLHQLFADAGREKIGWKLGLTSKPALDMFGASEPMVGMIYADSLLGNGATLAPHDVVSPRIEGEILLEIGVPPKPGSSDDDLIASLASASAAFEVADSHYQGWPTAIGGAIADNACSGWLMRAPQEASPQDVDFIGTEMEITADGKTISQGKASACLGSVLETYRWFVEDSHECGRELKPGEIILTGAMGPAIPMEAGSSYRLLCPGLGSATLEFGGTA